MPVVAGLAVVIIALFALLLLYGSAELGKILANIFPKSIGVGPASIHPRQWIESGVHAALSAAQWIVGDVIRPIVGFVARPVIAVLDFVQSVSNFCLSTGQEISWLVHNAIPEALSAAKTYAHNLVNSAESYALSLYHRAESYTLSKYNAVHAYASSLYHSATAYALAKYNAVHAYASSLYHSATAYALAKYYAAIAYTAAQVKAVRADMAKSIAKVEGEIKNITKIESGLIAAQVATGVKAAEAYAAKAAAGVTTTITADVVGSADHLFAGVLADVVALEGVIATDLPDIGAAVRAIPRVMPKDIAGAIALPLTLSIPMLRYMRECGVPNCKRLGGMGHFLEDLLGAAETGALLAMLVEMINDPEGAAHTAADELGDLVDEAKGLATSLLGVG